MSLSPEALAILEACGAAGGRPVMLLSVMAARDPEAYGRRRGFAIGRWVRAMVELGDSIVTERWSGRDWLIRRMTLAEQFAAHPAGSDYWPPPCDYPVEPPRSRGTWSRRPRR